MIEREFEIVEDDFAVPSRPEVRRHFSDFIDVMSDSTKVELSLSGDVVVSISPMDSCLPVDDRSEGSFGFEFTKATTSRAFESFCIQPKNFEPSTIEQFVDARALIEFLPPNPTCHPSVKPHRPAFRSQPPQLFDRRGRFLHVKADNRHWGTTIAWQRYFRTVLSKNTDFNCPPLLSTLPPMHPGEILAGMRQTIIESAKRMRATPLFDVTPLHLQAHGFAFGDDSASLLCSRMQSVASPSPAGAEVTDGVLADEPTKSEVGEGTESQSGLSSKALSMRHNQAMHQTQKHHTYAVKRNLEYWIALKGIVFRINFDTDFPGRNLYYKMHLAPVYSGRECTECFAAAVEHCDLKDFAGASSTLAPSFATARRTGRQQSNPSPQHHRKITNGFTELQKQHVNNIFSLFLNDFDIIGVMVDGEDLWI